jgi:hypothetical protein
MNEFGLDELNELLKEKEFKFPGFVLSYELKELKELLLYILLLII